ncbi:MAG: methionine synthase [Oscillospiraceae bacterium]|nr:methionine synthase [Oscillospiraceae bacterium]
MKPNIDEILRYLRVRGEAPEELRAQVEAAAEELAETLRPQFVYRVFPLERGEGGVALQGSGVTLTGGLASKMLRSCDAAVLLCCTLGMEFERRLRALERRDMGKAVILDACGSAWVESGCDAAEREIAERFSGRFLTDRFSPGYGDLPLSLQRSVLDALDARRRLGIHLSESFLMTPSKSVTAVIGLSDTPQPARVRGCGYCAMKGNCDYRKGGTTCAV